jgi:polyphosphate kinase
MLKIFNEILSRFQPSRPQFEDSVFDESAILAEDNKDQISRQKTKEQDKESSAKRYLNREISDLQFIERVAQECERTNHPLLERVRFLGIAASVLDQFYTVRVAKLKLASASTQLFLSPDGLTSKQQLEFVNQRCDKLQPLLQSSWANIEILLAEESIEITTLRSLSKPELSWLLDYFNRHVKHVLTPFSLDEEHPFPFVRSGGICTVLELNTNRVLIPLPANLPRFIALPGATTRFVTLESLCQQFWQELFPNQKLVGFGVFQILRDNFLAREERSADLRTMIESGLKSRHKANVTLLKFSQDTSEQTIRFVAKELGMINDEEIEQLELQAQSLGDTHQVYLEPLVGLSDISSLINSTTSERHHNLLFDTYEARYPQLARSNDGDLFKTISSQDLLVHWPYESFDVVKHFLQQASKDPNVLSIKQTLYRTSENSPIVQSLIEAAENGKAVTVVIELEARDNEASNVKLAKRLEDAGAQIVYGIIGLKIHCKATFVSRLENDRLVMYSHFGTGNYHPDTARIYTDLSFFTKNKKACEDISRVFNYLTSNHFVETEHLVVAPVQIRNRLITLIENESLNAEAGKPAAIWIKVNSLTDPQLIDKLYLASEAGVKIELIVRRHCSLIPGVEGLSNNITVRSIVGRFLEHARIYCFANGGEMESESSLVYLASADWMERNFDERVEIMVPLEDKNIRNKVVTEIMGNNIKDNMQSWYLASDGEYYPDDSQVDFCAQSWFMKNA